MFCGWDDDYFRNRLLIISFLSYIIEYTVDWLLFVFVLFKLFVF